LNADGFETVAGVLTADQVESLTAAVAAVANQEALSRAGAVYGIRDLLRRVPAVRELAESPTVRALVDPVLGTGVRPVRGIFFDKAPGANWKVPWHQDLTVAVRERRAAEGFGPWSVKEGGPHVQPPVEVLERMLAVRLHLDDCGPDNGPLQVLPGTHRLGRLGAERITELTAEREAVTCAVPVGGALLMRPLLLHRSSAAVSPRHRRVVHIEFAAGELPAGLEWHETSR
jgi:hypothetical protein